MHPPGDTADTAPRRRSTLPLAGLLGGVMGGLVLVTAAVVLAVALGAALRNTTTLQAQRAEMVVRSLRARIDDHLRPAEALVSFVGTRLERGELRFDDRDSLVAALRYTLAAAPQLGGAAVLSAEGWSLVANRGEEGEVPVVAGRWSDRAHLRTAVAMLRDSGSGSGWGPPVYIEERGETILPYARAVRRDGRFLGGVVAFLPISGLSRFVAELSRDIPGEAFVLYGRQRVLAHPEVGRWDFRSGPDAPLPSLEDTGDVELAAIWWPGFADRRLESRGEGHWQRIPGVGKIFYLYARLDEDRPLPWYVGAYFEAEDVRGEMRRLWAAGVAGTALSLLALVASLLLARRLARPVVAFAGAARAVAELRLAEVHVPRRSRIRELDEAARAFAGMVSALAAFTRYVPRDLVLRLLRTGRGQRPERRRLTVLFTDLAGFTGLAESLDAEATTRLLERHYAMLASCIEAAGGTVDKFMGDGVMAFWGAPEPVSDHAERAMRAARAMARGHLATRGEPHFLPLRIGVHTGDALVGEIETEARVTYTVAGDTVNTAARLQEAVKDVLGRPAVGILLSEATRSELANGEGLRDAGTHVPRGRHTALRLYALVYE